MMEGFGKLYRRPNEISRIIEDDLDGGGDGLG